VGTDHPHSATSLGLEPLWLSTRDLWGPAVDVGPAVGRGVPSVCSQQELSCTSNGCQLCTEQLCRRGVALDCGSILVNRDDGSRERTNYARAAGSELEEARRSRGGRRVRLLVVDCE
jgi:hypothetical protein